MNDTQPSTSTFAGMHNMSRTAGAATSEYTAVNTACVAALVSGLGSMLALMSNVLLIVPIVAIVFGVAGIVQVTRSNRTQTGLLLAGAGIIAAIAFSAVSLGQQTREAAATAADRQAIAQLMQEFEQHLLAGEYDQAYAQFSVAAQGREAQDRFLRRMTYYTGNWGTLESIRLGEVVKVIPDPVTGTATAASMANFKSTNVPEDRRGVSFVRRDQGWKIEKIEQWF